MFKKTDENIISGCVYEGVFGRDFHLSWWMIKTTPTRAGNTISSTQSLHGIEEGEILCFLGGTSISPSSLSSVSNVAWFLVLQTQAVLKCWSS